MATRKEPIDIEYDEPQQEAVSDAVESNYPYESQDPADWVPSMTVRTSCITIKWTVERGSRNSARIVE